MEARAAASPEADSAVLADLRRALRMQKFFAQMFVIPTYLLVWSWMRFIMGYRIRDLRKIREHIATIRSQGDPEAPFLICSNHLTMIDSFLVIWSLGSCPHYLQRFRHFPWNLPEKGNFSGNLAIRVLCYLGKCIPVIRQGPREEVRRMFEKILFLFQEGEYVMVFPEGGRSRSGRVDTDRCTYGVGQMLRDHPGLRVLSLYIRGDSQETYSYFPKRKETFSVSLEEIYPRTSQRGLRASRDLSLQIMNHLVSQEESWLQRNRQQP